tara:strand:- start:578 stop:829 length:252 start_codon:yes stop_codon:yes gene_type:complete
MTKYLAHFIYVSIILVLSVSLLMQSKKADNQVNLTEEAIEKAYQQEILAKQEAARATLATEKAMEALQEAEKAKKSLAECLQK